MSVPFANAIETLKRYRYVLLAGTLLSTLAVPQWNAVSDARAKEAMRDGSFVIAQRVDPNDPNQKGKQKGQPDPKGQKGQGQPQGQPQAQPGQGQPSQGQPSQGQPKQLTNQPAAGTPPTGTQTPAGTPQQQQQKQFGKQAPGGTPQIGTQTPTGTPQIGTQTPTGTPQQQQRQKQFGKQVPGGTPAVGTQTPTGTPQIGTQTPTGNPPPQQPLQKQFGKQAPTGTPPVGTQTPTGTPQIGTQTPTGNPPPQQPLQKQFGKQAPAGTPQIGTQTPAGTPPQQQQQFGNQPPGTTPQIGGQPPAQPQITINNNTTVRVDQVRTQRQQVVEPNGRIVIQEPGNRHIIRENGRVIIRNDDNVRFQMFAPNAQVTRRGSENFMVYERPGGFQIINVTDANGHLLRRIRRGPDGREYVLIDNRRGPGLGTGLAVGLGVGVVASAVYLSLAPPVVTIPRERYIVTAAVAPPALLYEALDAPPLVAIERPYSLDEIRYNVELRDRVRRIDIDTITFETGSWEVSPAQYGLLAQIAQAMLRVIERNPDTVFMVEGHTDAVGTNEDNLSLSDRRAESVAVILTQQFQIGPEHLVTQGYGEQHLKIPSDGPNRENRRVAVRNITRLMQAQNTR